MKSRVYVFSVFFLVLNLIFSSLPAFSQPQPSPSGPEKLLFIQSGDAEKNITINTFDKARLEAEYLSVIKARDQRAYEFLSSSLEVLHGGLKDLGVIVRKLSEQSDESLGTFVPAQGFMAAVRDFEQSLLFLNDKIHSLGLLPDLRTDARKELSGIINFAPLKEHYLQQIKSIKDSISRSLFHLKLPSGAIYSQTGIDTTSLKQMQLYSAETMNQLHQLANTKKMMTTKEHTVIDGSINAFTRKALETYIDVFGTSERFHNSSDQEGRLKAAQALYDVFWTRFYIRAVYGIKIGSIPVQYQKRIFNLDYLISDVKIGSTPLWEESNLRTALNLATEAQATLSNKNANYFASALRHFIVKSTGSGAAQNNKLLIINLVRIDLEEELKLGKPGGLREVRASYRQNYMGTEQDKLITQQKQNATFVTEGDDIESDVLTIEAGTLRGVIAQCRSVLEQMERRLEEARQIENSLSLLDSNNPTSHKRKLRAEL